MLIYTLLYIGLVSVAIGVQGFAFGHLAGDSIIEPLDFPVVKWRLSDSQKVQSASPLEGFDADDFHVLPAITLAGRTTLNHNHLERKELGKRAVRST